MSRPTKTKFTAIDIENNLYDLATNVMKKTVDTHKVTTAVAAYNSIIKLQALKLKAQIMLPKAEEQSILNNKKSLTIK